MKLTEILSRFDSDPRITEHDGLVVICPSHPDTNPSLKLSITESGQFLLKCRTGICESADVIRAVGLTWSDLDHPELDTDLLEPVTTRERDAAELELLELYVNECATQFVGSPAEIYASERFGISAAEAAALRLGFSAGTRNIPGLIGPTWNDGPRLVVPFLDPEGHVVGAQGRSLVESEMRWCSLIGPSAKVAVMRNPNGLDTWIVTEGPGDALAAFAAGFNAVAVRGAALTSATSVLASLFSSTTVGIAGDNDDAGRKFADRTAKLLRTHGVDASVLTVPGSVNDVSAWRESSGPSFRSELESAVRSMTVPDELEIAQTKYLPTDSGNAHRLAAEFAGKVAHVPGLGFETYDGGVWSTTEHGVDLAWTAAQQLGERIASEGDYKWGTATGMSSHIQACRKELQNLVKIPLSRFDQHPLLLNFANCVVDLSTGLTQPHDPSLYMTKQLPTNYNPDAQCPRWISFLDEVFPENPEMPAFLQRLLGYGATGLTTEHCLVINYGTGANGKSVFQDTLRFVFGQFVNVTPFSTFEQKHYSTIPSDVAKLQGARFVLASEGDAGAPMNEALIKSITGGDSITARLMYKDFFTFTPEFLLLLATNHRPTFKSQDEGLWRRVKLVPWKRTFAPAERDHYLVEKLREEAEGIAAWVVRGAGEWYRNGLGDPKSVTSATRDFRVAVDPLQGFFPGVLVHDPDKAKRMTTTEVYALYTQWTAEEGLQSREHWNRSTLLQALEERGCARVQSKGVKCLKNIRPMTPADLRKMDDE